MLRARTLLAFAALACGLSLVFASAAMAAGEYELNDSRDAAYGPLKGGTDYAATLETDNDADWYVFYVKAYSQLDFSATSLKADACTTPYIDLRDKDGNFIESFRIGAVNVTNHLYLTLNPGRYYLEVQWPGCAGDRYRFRIDPATAITPSRDCGEAIVARDAIPPLIAKLNDELAENSVDLARASGPVRRLTKLLRRLKREGAPRGNKLAARRKLTRAKAARKRIVDARAGLNSLGAQYQQSLAQAEGQIALYC
jgi:hypothetical protein